MALTITDATRGNVYVTAQVFNTVSFTIPVDSVACLVVIGYDTTNNGSRIPTVTSTALSGITNLHESRDFQAGVDGYWADAFWGAGTGVAGTTSIDWGVAYEGCEWLIFQVSPASGNTVSVLQGKTATVWTTAVTPMTVTLAALTAGSAIVSGESHYADTQSITPGAGYTELYDADVGLERHHGQYRLDPVSATVTATSAAGASQWEIGAFEVLEVAGASLAVGILPVGF